MSVIVPTVTAASQSEYERQLTRIKPFATRLHIDLMDGDFAPTTSLPLEEVRLLDGLIADVHLMYRDPSVCIDRLVELQPNLVIIHAEARGDFASLASKLHAGGIKVGLALLPDTEVKTIEPAIAMLDHVLIFSGNLGHQGGSWANPNLLVKIDQLRRLDKDIEIGWDGGVNDENAKALSQAGIQVLNVGGYIQNSVEPEKVYNKLVHLTK